MQSLPEEDSSGELCARVKFPPRYKYAGLPFSRVLLGVKCRVDFLPALLSLREGYKKSSNTTKKLDFIVTHHKSRKSKIILLQQLLFRLPQHNT
ncbi:MAG: hypothetical protein MJK14_08585, partial [Rivularia sp. ALOHA_DT_140]|nr:hypothetical protein [Rivularia sp. ALOHA_DT_140]